MRHLLFLLLLAASPATAADRVSLRPFEGRMGFEPQALQPITSQHPLYGRILLEDVQAMPDRIGSFLMRVTSSSEFNQSLRSTLASANMLARSPAEARARLRVTWRRFHLPLQIGLTTRATAAVHYELSRIDNGQIIYSREIVTQAVGRGGNGAIRGQGTGRASILSNIASITHCLEQAPFTPPSDACILRPVGRFSAPIVVSVPLIRR